VTVLTPPRHPLVDDALADARRWCAGHVIDSRPALTHAVRVAVLLGEHLTDPDPQLIAAALLHDAPEFAPADLDLDEVLERRYGRHVVRIVRALATEHHALDTATPTILVPDAAVLLVSTADKIVALTSLARRAEASGDPEGFFATRAALLSLIPAFQAFRAAGAGRVPASMSDALGLALDTLPLPAGARA
jgi:(p)ppGpp synthase/HD superfamily hydrolase